MSKAKPKDAPPLVSPVPAKRTRGGPKDIRITDVARLARVSPITVSRAFNQPSAVAPETLKRIRQTVHQLGYVPNRLAGSLSSSRSRLIAAIVPTVAHSLFSGSIQAFSNTMSGAGYQVLLGLSGYPDVDDEWQLLDAVLSRRPEGMLLTGVARSASLRARLLNLRIPTVETWDTTDVPIDMLVGFSHYEVGAAVARRFLETGRRRPALVSADDDRATVRRRGFLETLARHGIADVAQVIVKPPSSIGLGKDALDQVLSGNPAVDAIFCGSDLLALGVLACARTRALEVPGQLAVCGFGDLDFAAAVQPALTTIRVDGARIGVNAARCLIDRLNGSPLQPKVDVGFELMVRDTA